MENEKKITILTQKNLDYLLSNSVRSLPANPTSAGYTAERIKEKQWLPSKILFEYLTSFQGNVSEAFVEAYTNLTSLDAKIDNEATARLNGDNALLALIRDIAQHGIAKFDDDYNVIKDTYVKKAQIVNNVTSEGENNKPLGAGQGYVLQHQIDAIKTLLASDDTTLDELQEIVTYIKNNKSLIDGITTNKVNVTDIIDNLTSEITNKPLSANQGYVLKGLIDLNTAARHSHENKAVLDAIEEAFTTALKSKLDAIASGAQVNVIEGVQVNGTDLTPDANKKVNVDISGKLDKSTSSEAKVYGVSNGSQTMWGVGQGANGSKLVQRTSAGQVNVPETPTANEHATSKKYVDDTIAAIKRDAYKVVDFTTYTTLNSFLATTGEEGFLYLYPIDTSDLTKGYYRYIWENSAWLALGTTQIDLSPYYTASQTDTLLGGKVDKKTTTGTFAYTHDGSTEGEVAYTSSDTASTLVMRDANKQINIAETPTDDSHAASKKYVDTGLSGKATKAEHLKSLYHLGEYDSVDTSNADYDVGTKKGGYIRNLSGWATDSQYAGNYRYYVNLPYPIDTAWTTVRDYFKIAEHVKANYPLGNYFTGAVGVSLCYDGTQPWVGVVSSTELTVGQLNALGIEIEYELTSSYTEYYLKNQPLSTLDQQGENWLRGMYEKQLNLFAPPILRSDKYIDPNDGVMKTASGNYAIENYIPVEPNATYYLSTGESYVGVAWGAGYSSPSESSYVGAVYVYMNGTTTIPSGVNYIRFTAGADVSKYMLTETDYPVPYQPYNGKVMHAIDVEGVLLWENGSPTSSFAGATSVDVGDMSKYSKIRILFRATTTFLSYDHIDIPYMVGNRWRLFFPSDDATYIRGAIIDATNIVKFDSCYQTNITTGAVVTYNDFLIPVAIYGIK